MADETNINFPLSSAEIENKERLYETLHAFDMRNAGDPNTISWRGTQFPYELFYALRLFRRVLALDPGASEALMLASRCQHLCRWNILRNTFPDGRKGYLDWRDSLKAFHADEAAKVLDQFGYPAGMPRRMAVPLSDLPPGTDRLRITTNQEIYWDRLAIAFAQDSPPVARHALALAEADVRRSGFAERTTGPQRLPHYDYDNRSPFWDTRHQAGSYTEFGPAAELVSKADGAMAIFGPGEETHLEYDATTLGPPPEGWTRRFVLETHGWCKDMDLYTRDGATIAPLPGTRDDYATTLHEKYNTRYEAGR